MIKSFYKGEVKMNKISDEEIYKYLQEKWNEVKSGSGINPHNLMGIFAIGKVCHGFCQDIKDIDLVCCYVPTFEELCLNTYRYKYEERYNSLKKEEKELYPKSNSKTSQNNIKTEKKSYYILEKDCYCGNGGF